MRSSAAASSASHSSTRGAGAPLKAHARPAAAYSDARIPQPSAAVVPAPERADALAERWAAWLGETMAPEIDLQRPPGAEPLPQIEAKQLLPLLRGRMLRAVPMMLERVRPAATARMIAHNVRVAEAQQQTRTHADPAGAPVTPGPHHPRQARLDALRQQRAALQHAVASKREALQAVSGDVSRAKLDLAAQQDALSAARQARDVDLQRRALRQAFLSERAQAGAVWAEYAQRIRSQAMLPDSDGQQQPAAQKGQQHFKAGSVNGTNNSTAAGELETASQRCLRAAFKVVHESFEATFAQAQRDAEARHAELTSFDRPPDSQPTPFAQLTPEWCAARAELRALFPVSGQSSADADAAPSATRFDARSFLHDLSVEVERSTQQLHRRREEVELQNRDAAAAPKSTSSSDDTASSAPPAGASLVELLDGLIGTLQDESATRFLQAQKLQNEAAGSEVLLAELLAKQRAGDADVAAASTRSFEQSQFLQSLRRFQSLRLSLAALKSQLSFASKTFATFANIRDARAKAWKEFESQKSRVENFAATRKNMEQRMVELVVENKELRNKFGQQLQREYDSRLREFLSTELHPLCVQLGSTSRSLVDSLSREMLEANAAMVCPLSLVQESVVAGGKGRIPISRLGINLIQTPTLQLNQLHALIVDPFGSDARAQPEAGTAMDSVAGNVTFKGLANFPLYQNSTQVLAHVQRLAQQALHLLLVARFSVVSFQQLLSPGGPAAPSALALVSGSQSQRSAPGGLVVAGMDVSNLAEWAKLRERMQAQRNKQEQEWMPQLHGVLSDASTLSSSSLPRLARLLRSFASEPAQTLVPNLRNRIGYNIDDYVLQVRTLCAQVEQQQQRYARKIMQQRM